MSFLTHDVETQQSKWWQFEASLCLVQRGLSVGLLHAVAAMTSPSVESCLVGLASMIDKVIDHQIVLL